MSHKAPSVTHSDLRDWFAGQALIGIMLRMTAETRKRYRDGHADGREAQIAYAIADAMLLAREPRSADPDPDLDDQANVGEIDHVA